MVLREHFAKLGLSGGKLFGYLAKLSQSPRCFAVEACRLRESEDRIEQERAGCSESKSSLSRLSGKR